MFNVNKFYSPSQEINITVLFVLFNAECDERGKAIFEEFIKTILVKSGKVFLKRHIFIRFRHWGCFCCLFEN
jgi:hypothetical protein